MVEMVQRTATRWILSSFSPYQNVMELQPEDAGPEEGGC